MLDACASHSRWIDVFCERGAFDGDQTRAILRAGVERGLLARVHANQLEHGPGVQIAVEFDAASADHATHLDDDDVAALAGSDTVATLLPAAEFSTRAAYPDARRLLDAGATVALAADCNPGSSFTTSIPFCIAIAVREMGMTPDEALWSATLGGARALRRTDVGLLAPGRPRRRRAARGALARAARLPAGRGAGGRRLAARGEGRCERPPDRDRRSPGAARAGARAHAATSSARPRPSG